jgi:succinoglycan biosynthesis protein ExoO
VLLRQRDILRFTAVTPSITVLIAAYNAEGFVGRAVASALTQSLAPLEVLVVDDASTDDTVAVVRQLAGADSRVRLITLPQNGGPSAARNAGLDAARGEWVAVLDADDAFMPQRLQTMLSYAVESGADIVVDNFRSYKPATNSIGPAVLDEGAENSLIPFADFLARARPLRGEADWGLLKPIFRQAFLQEHGLRYPLASRHGEDFLFMVDAFAHGARYALVREAGYLYTGRSSNLSRSTLNYHLMYEHTRALIGDERFRTDPLLVRRLHERAAAVRLLAAITDYERFRRERDYVSLARRVLLDNTFRTFIGKKLVRSLVRLPAKRQAPAPDRPR